MACTDTHGNTNFKWGSKDIMSCQCQEIPLCLQIIIYHVNFLCDNHALTIYMLTRRNIYEALCFLIGKHLQNYNYIVFISIAMDAERQQTYQLSDDQYLENRLERFC